MESSLSLSRTARLQTDEIESAIAEAAEARNRKPSNLHAAESSDGK